MSLQLMNTMLDTEMGALWKINKYAQGTENTCTIANGVIASTVQIVLGFCPGKTNQVSPFLRSHYSHDQIQVEEARSAVIDML